MAERITLHRVSRLGLLKALRPHGHDAFVRTGIVTLLGSRPGRVFSHREIAEWLYAEREDGGPEWAMGLVRVSVLRLRRQGVPILTHRGRGYSLMRAA